MRKLLSWFFTDRVSWRALLAGLMCAVSVVAGALLTDCNRAEEREQALQTRYELEACISLWEGCRERLGRACEPELWPAYGGYQRGIPMPWCVGAMTATDPPEEPVRSEPDEGGTGG